MAALYAARLCSISSSASCRSAQLMCSAAAVMYAGTAGLVSAVAASVVRSEHYNQENIVTK